MVPDYYAQAYENLYHWFLNLLYYTSSSNALKPYLVKPSDVKEIATFIFWGALVAELGYTNGFPYMPPLMSPSPAVTLASWSMFIALLVMIMGLLSFVIPEILKTTVSFHYW